MCFVGDLLARLALLSPSSHSLSLSLTLFACLDSEQVGARSLKFACSLSHTQAHVLCSRVHSVALSLPSCVCVRALSGSAAVDADAAVDVDVDFVVVVLVLLLMLLSDVRVLLAGGFQTLLPVNFQ